MRANFIRSAAFALGVMLAGLLIDALPFQASKPSPEAREHYTRARRYLARRDQDKALEELKVAIRLAPEFVEAHREYLAIEWGRAAALVQQYEAYVKQNPTSAAFHYLLGRAYSNARRPEDADAEYQKALEIDPTFGWAQVALASSALRRGDVAQAVEWLEKARRSSDKSPELSSELVTALSRAKQFASALEEAEQLVKLNPAYYDAYPLKWQAQMSLKRGSDEVCAEIAKELRDFETKYARNLEGLLAVQRGYIILDDEEGQERTRKAILALDPKFFDRVSIMMADIGKRIQVSSQMLQRFTEVQKLKDAKEQLEAYRRLEKEVKEADMKLYYLYPSMFNIYLRLGDLDGAEKIAHMMRKAGMGQPRLAQHQISLAQRYMAQRIKFDRALKFVQAAVEGLRQALKQSSGDPRTADSLRWRLTDALHMQSRILMEKKLIGKEGTERAEAYRQLQRERLEAYCQLEKEMKDADMRLNTLFPSMFQSYLALQDLNGAQRMLEAMKTAGMEASRLAPHQVSLARAYLQWRVKLDRAQELVQEAIEKMRQTIKEREAEGDSHSTYIKGSLANALHVHYEILMQRGMPEQARESLVESVKLDEQEMNTLDLGLAYSNAGKLDEAIEMLAKAYGFQGPRRNQAKLALELIYGEREKTKPLTTLLDEAVERRKKQREAMTAAVRAPLPIAPRATAEPIEPKPAPAFELATLLSGQKMRLSDFRGKVVVLNFWATW